MKRFQLIQLLFVIISVMIFSACEEKEPFTRTSRLEVSSVALTFNAIDTFRTVYIANDLPYNYKILHGANWIKLLPGKNGRGMDTIRVMVDDYSNKLIDRYDTIVVSSGTAKDKLISVRQNYLRDTIGVDIDSVAYEPFIRGAVEITVTTDATNGWQFLPSGYDWIKLAKSTDGNKLLLTVDEFWYGAKMRVGDVTIETIPLQPNLAVVRKTIPVTQVVTPTTLLVEPEAISYTAGKTGTQIVNITTDAESWEFELDSDLYNWLTVAKSADNKQLEVTVNSIWDGETTGKERTAYITIISGSTKLTFRVTQDIT